MKERINNGEGKNKIKKKKAIILMLSIVGVLLIAVGISYAFWMSFKVQENTNIIASGCLNVSLEGENPINLANAYPITDSDGEKTIPYTFTITNNCASETNYIVSLESLESSTFDSSKIKVMFDSDKRLYSGFKETEKHFGNSKDARMLTRGLLEENGSVTYNLRMWIDENVTSGDQNKIFNSKVVVKTTLGSELSSLYKVGDYIRMTPTSTSYTPSSELTGCLNDADCTQNTLNPSELNLWRVIKVNNDDTIDVISEHVSSAKVFFRGETGYLNFIGGLNAIAAQYTNENYVIKTRYMGYSNQVDNCSNLSTIDCEEDTGYEEDTTLVQNAIGNLIATKTDGTTEYYWLASRHIDTSSDGTTLYFGRWIGITGHLNAFYLVNNEKTEYSHDNALRPILTLKADLEPISGDGKSKDTAYTFE